MDCCPGAVLSDRHGSAVAGGEMVAQLLHAFDGSPFFMGDDHRQFD